MKPYLSDIQKTEDDTLMMDSALESPKGSKIQSKSIPIIEAPVVMSNPIWSLITRAGGFYRIFRQDSDIKIPPSAANRWKLLRV
uniref:Uncharacterized protein n=1 Tax=Acrobeloides nanus TaxID=290746 RepID=A0A914DP09_9BILA